MKNNLTLSFLFLSLTLLPASGAPVQWTTAVGGNGHWYELVSTASIFESVDFATAQSGAASRTHLGQTGYLATVTSAAENAFLRDTFNILIGFGGGGSAYLGATRQAGGFTWVGGPETGQTVTYTNWAAGHPAAAPGYDFLLMLEGNGLDGQWAAGTSPGTFGYFVEYADGSQSAVPEPSTVALAAAGLLIAAGRYRGFKR